jgi:SAM-dependent methyltransferase
MNCRFCGNILKEIFLDLGSVPPSNASLTKANLKKKEVYYPLKVFVCKKCWLVQTKDYLHPKKLFTKKYKYFSSISHSFLLHAKNYVDKIIKELSLSNKSYVIEIGSNDGYLLKNFLEKNIPCLGIEPTNTAKTAEKNGIKVLREFFTKDIAHKLSLQGKKADLIIANNVYAHVPNINDFTEGLKKILNKNGTITIEFHHLLNLIKLHQFDVIYHEHFSYLSLHVVREIFKKSGLRIFNVKKINTHGGSLQVYACHFDDNRKTHKSVNLLLNEEKKKGLKKIETYRKFKKDISKIKNNLLNFLSKIKKKRVVGFCASAKGNSMLNYCNINKKLLPVIFDSAKSKQNLFMCKSHIPIVSPKNIFKIKPDYVIILSWNISEEIINQFSMLKKNKTKFFAAIPEIRIL